MDQIQQILGEIERKHKQELAQLQAQHKQQLREHSARYEARILSLRTTAGLENERRIQEAAFDEQVFSHLCSWVKSDYDPAKYPPNVHTLVQALSVKPEDEMTDDTIDPHQVSYHQVAAFRDFIVESFQTIGAAIVRQQDGFLSQEAEFEIGDLQVQNKDLQWECDMAESKIARLQSEVHVQQSKVHQLLSLLTRLAGRLDKPERTRLLLFLERFESMERRHEIRKSTVGVDAAIPKRESDDSTIGLGRNVRARVENEETDSEMS